MDEQPIHHFPLHSLTQGIKLNCRGDVLAHTALSRICIAKIHKKAISTITELSNIFSHPVAVMLYLRRYYQFWSERN